MDGTSKLHAVHVGVFSPVGHLRLFTSADRLHPTGFSTLSVLNDIYIYTNKHFVLIFRSLSEHILAMRIIRQSPELNGRIWMTGNDWPGTDWPLRNDRKRMTVLENRKRKWVTAVESTVIPGDDLFLPGHPPIHQALQKKRANGSCIWLSALLVEHRIWVWVFPEACSLWANRSLLFCGAIICRLTVRKCNTSSCISALLSLTSLYPVLCWRSI